MNLTELRQLVRRTIRKQINEARVVPGAPTSWGDFRKQFAEKLEMAGAPLELVEEVGDVGSEGGGVAQVLYDAWQNIESELKGEPDADTPNIWQEVVEFYVHDAVIDMVSEFENSWNYAPGARGRGKTKPIDASALAKEVVKAWTPQKKQMSGDEKKARDMKSMVNLVVDVLEQAGASGVTPTSNSVQYDMTDDMQGKLAASCKRSGFKPAGPGTWLDDITGLKVQFKYGNAKIS